MNYYQRNKNRPPYACASTPTMSMHAPAQFQESELASSSGWYGDSTNNSPPIQHVESQAPTFQQTMPNNFEGPQGYYHNGCWYNARVEKHADTGVMVQTPPASSQQQQQQQQQHFYQYQQQQQQNLHQQQQQQQLLHQQQQQPQPQQQQQQVPQYYIFAQPGQQQPMASVYPLQQQHVTPLHPSQQQHVTPLHPSQQQQQQPAMLATYPYQQGQQQQVWPQSYPSQQQQHQQQQILPQPCQSQPVMSPAYPSQGQQQQPQLVLVPTYPSQGQQQQQQQPQQQNPIVLQPCTCHQQGQIVPQSYQSQQLMSPQQQIPLSAQYQQITLPVQQQQQQQQQQHAIASREVPIVSHTPMAPDVGTTPQAMLQNQAPQIEMESPEMPQEAKDEGGPEEAKEIPLDELDMNLGPGVQATRSHNKLTIDIDLSHVDNGVPERSRSVDDMMRDLVRLIRGCVFRNPLPRRRRNRFLLRHAVVPRARPARDRVQRVLVAEKETQTGEEENEVVPSQIEVPESVQESPSSSQTLVTPELLSHPTLLQEQLLSETSSPRILFQEELCLEQPVAVDLICDQAFQVLNDPKQQDNAQPCDQAFQVLNEPKQPDNAQPMATGLDTLEMAKMSPQRDPKEDAPLLSPEPKKPMDEASSWPPLGTRPATKARLVNPKGSFYKPSQRFNENRSFSRSYFGAQRQYKGNSNDSATFQPKRILRNMERYGEDLAKTNGDNRAEPAAAAENVPAGNLNDNSQPLKAPQNRPLISAANDKRILSRRQNDVLNSLQDKKHSFQSFKQKQPESKLIAGNMFALLEESGVEPPPPVINAGSAGEEKDNVEKDDVDALIKAAKRAKKQKRKIKKREKARVLRLEEKEKNLKAVALKGPTSSPGNNSGQPCEIHFMGELQVTGLTVIEKKKLPMKFLLFRNAKAEEISNETSAEISTETTAEISTKTTAEISTETTAEISTETTAEISTETTAEISTEISTKTTAEISTETSAENSTEATAEISTETTAENSTITKPAEGGDPTQPAMIPVESQEEFPSLGAQRGRRRSNFLNAVAEYAVSRKSPEENQLPAKRNLWAKRRQPEQPGKPES